MDVDIAKLRELRATGTEGDWLVDYCYAEGGPPGGIFVQPAPDDFRGVLRAKERSLSTPDAELITAAVNALVPLLDALDSCTSELVRLRKRGREPKGQLSKIRSRLVFEVTPEGPGEDI